MTTPAPTVAPGSFLTLHYRLAGPDGADLVNTFADKLPATLTLGAGELAPAIEARLIGLPEGTHTRIELAPGEAFGERNPELLQRVKRSLMRELGDPDEEYHVGDVVQITGNPGREAGDYRLRMQFLRRPADGFEWGRKPGETFN